MRLPSAVLSLLPLVASIVLFASLPASSHESGFTSLHLRVDGSRVEGTWELTTADALILLNPERAQADPLPEPRALERGESSALGELLRQRLRLDSPDGTCPIAILGEVPPSGAELPGSRAAVALAIEARCTTPIDELHIRYPILFDLDERHRGYYSVQDFRGYQAGVFTVDRQEALVDVHRFSHAQIVREYGWEGVWHIWTGIDHVLFLIALLLPSVLPRQRGASRTLGGEVGSGASGENDLRAVLGNVVWIVSAFTVAHSITLSLAYFGVVRLPSRPVEVVIAASVFVVAWNNVRPFLVAPHSGAWMAFGFGLVHGFGFAGALAALGLPSLGRMTALLSFNLGVEAGQLVIVAAVLPLLYGARGTRAYEVWAVRGGSLLIGWLSVLWIVERILDVDLVSWI